MRSSSCSTTAIALEAAATAADLSFGLWQHGDGAGSATWMARALELVGDGGRSRHEAHVLAQAARRSMLAGDSEEAIELAGRAMELATSIGVEAVRVGALITRATAKANFADYRHVREDLEEAAELALASDPSEAGRAYVNLGSVLLEVGDVQGAIATARQAIAIGERMGMIGGSGGFAFGNLVEAQFIAGDWDEATATSIAELERADRTGGLYQEPLFRLVLAELAFVRDGRAEEAVETARSQVAAARERNDDQAVFGVCSLCAWTFVRAGVDDEAGAMLDELLSRRRNRPWGVAPGWWTVAIALTLERLGRSGALLALPEPEGSRFLVAARAIDAGEAAAGAEILRELGARPFEAESRVLAARDALAAGDGESAVFHASRSRELLLQLDARARLAQLADGLRSHSGGS